jgi:hypothetical protein
MKRVPFLVLVLAVASLAGAAPAGAQAAPLPDRATLAAGAAKRFPQPVRAGDLIGRDVLQPLESQPVLGRIANVVRHADGSIDVLIRTGGVLGVGGRLVAVPIEAIALLGEHVALVGLKPEQLDALPTAGDAPGDAVPPDSAVRVGLTKPFH